ncbi:MAG: 30S ribosomal protein S8 [bacterium]|nr:30S ribosomal protein S8 [bacterium]
MMTIDPIADMLTQIRNALAVRKPEVVLPYSKFKHSLAMILEKQGWLDHADVADVLHLKGKNKPFKALRMHFKYDDAGSSPITGVKRVSKPGQRIYAKFGEIGRYRTGVGVTIISTPKGLMTDREAAKAKLGGEVICQIW